MPDDSKEDFKQSQSRHARRIEDERTMMDRFGVTRQQARAALTTFAARHEGPRPVARDTGELHGPPAPDGVRIAETKFEPRPFREAVVEKDRGKGGGSVTGVTTTFAVRISGIAMNANFLNGLLDSITAP